ncbi:HEAT repeat domain-containing protein [Gimesia chilikensis]|uniref:HEAT repeat domain-containing protein n=1 Tax=Gimesia chilikensis TaxID=2605989 RepID=UPI001659BDF0|nr:HEAT repeat domain-containing protein [Gimesia chilikensis]
MALSDEMNQGEIDWTAIARKLGTLQENGESGGSKTAREAVAMIIGSSNLRAAVDHYVSHKKGSELVRHVLWLLHPRCAMERCYEIYQNEEDSQTRRDAIELLRVVADSSVLPWIKGLLEDQDEGVQCWSAGIVDQLLWSHLVDPEKCEELLQLMQNHSNEQVRETHAFIIEYLNKRE